MRIAIDATSNCVVTGALAPSFASQNQDVAIVKYDPSGNILCASSLASGGDDQIGVSVDPYGNAYIGGDFLTVPGYPFVVGSYSLTPP